MIISKGAPRSLHKKLKSQPAFLCKLGSGSDDAISSIGSKVSTRFSQKVSETTGSNKASD